MTDFYKKLPGDMPPLLKQQWSEYFLKKDSRLCGFAFLFSLTLQFILSVLLIITDSLGLKGEIFDQAVNCFASVLIVFLPFLAAAILLKMPFKPLLSLKKPKKGTLLPIVLMGTGCIPIFQIAAVVIDRILQRFSLNTPQRIVDAAFAPPQGVLALILQFICVCVIASVTEEIAFRGILLSSIRRYGAGFCVMVSALMFGLFHANTQQAPFAFLFGLVLGAGALYTGSVWAGIILHGINNIFSLFISTLNDKLFEHFRRYTGYSEAVTRAENITLVVNYSLWAVMLISALVGLVVFTKCKAEGAFELEETGFEISSRSRAYKRFFLSPPVLAAVILFLAATLRMTSLFQSA